MNGKIAKLIASATTALALASFANAASASPEAWETANADYDAQRFAQAAAAYEKLAAQGDARAAELAGQMYAHGEKLYGGWLRRDPVRAARLLAQAADAGSPVAGYMIRYASANASVQASAR